jgi:hypothetical protein
MQTPRTATRGHFAGARGPSAVAARLGTLDTSTPLSDLALHIASYAPHPARSSGRMADESRLRACRPSRGFAAFNPARPAQRHRPAAAGLPVRPGLRGSQKGYNAEGYTTEVKTLDGRGARRWSKLTARVLR